MTDTITKANWTTVFPLYQIDFTAVSAGKTIGATKRRVRWRFGFANAESIEKGYTGPGCRGEEHELLLIWSITSGKRQILMDGKECHFSMNRSMDLDFSWNWRGNCVVKMVAKAAPSMTSVPDSRQYDFWINGQSFFDMPKMYELGLKGLGRPMHYLQGNNINTNGMNGRGGGVDRRMVQHQHQNGTYNNYSAPPAESYPSEPRSSYGQYNNHTGGAPVFAGAAAPPANNYASAPVPVATYSAAPVSLAPEIDLMSSNNPPAAGTDVFSAPTSYNGSAAPAYDQFSAPTVQPTYNDLSNQVLSIYSNSTANNDQPQYPAPTNGKDGVLSPLTCDSGSVQSHVNGHEMYNQPIAQKLDLATVEDDSHVDDITKGMKNLVNLDDINSPVEGDFRLTMDDPTAHKNKRPISKRAQDTPSYVGPQPSLGEMKSSRGVGKQTKTDIMKQPPANLFNPNAANGGTLVVYGEQQGGNGAVPPLHRPTGFGVGAHMQHGGYSSQGSTNGYNGHQYAY
uniref:Uncharacterized protein n=1 Tax=Leptocylindrus danicus TaxID=163516 RepID=A0A7S2LMF6_9STRA|mmetsp:Transcript_7583/g.11283  ORF Transcript_7583/g.11283 Transcript_7583/m.11283 type:complete len:509 (+) Transcript_7583:64-1590(+)